MLKNIGIQETLASPFKDGFPVSKSRFANIGTISSSRANILSAAVRQFLRAMAFGVSA